MKKLYEIYKLHPDDTRYRHELELRLIEKFSEKCHPSSQTTGVQTLWLPVTPLNNRHTQSKTTQGTHPVRTAIDQQSEQTINEDAKTTGV